MRFGAKVYHARRVYKENAEIAQYESPKSYVTRANYISVMPATTRGLLVMMSYGEDLDSTWTLVANERAFHGIFKEGDLMWVDGESPVPQIEAEYGNGASANAVVRSVSVADKTISIVLSRNKERVTQ